MSMENTPDMAGNTIDSHPDLYSYTGNVANQQIIGEDDMAFVHISVNITLQMTIAAVGLVTSIINTLIFSKLGFKDSMSVGLFSLSITDFFVASIVTSSCIFFITDIAHPSLDPKAWFIGYYFFAWAANSAISISSWITAIVSVERCICVASPFKVKQIFTRCRCAIAILTVYMLHIIVGLAYIILKLYGMDYSPVLPESNTSCMVLVSECMVIFTPGTSSFLAAIDLLYGVCVSVMLQVVVVASTVWMGYSLQVTSRVRVQSSELSSQMITSSSAKKITTSARERRLVKVVFCLAATLSICNAPQLMAAIAYNLVPSLRSEAQRYLSITMWTVTRIIGSVSGPCSFLVYFKLNRHYRHLFWKWFRCCS